MNSTLGSVVPLAMFSLFLANFQVICLTYFLSYSCYENFLWENSNAEIELTLLSVLGEPKYILGARLFSLNIPPSITIGAATLRVNTEWWVSRSPSRARPFLTAMLAQTLVNYLFWAVANIQEETNFWIIIWQKMIASTLSQWRSVEF